MRSTVPIQQVSLWRKKHLFNIDFAQYRLSNHSFSKHFHDHYVIELVTMGADEFYCSGNKFIAASNQLVFINPGEVHTGSTVSGSPLCYFSFYPHRAALDEVALALEINLPHDFSFKDTLLQDPIQAQKMTRLFALFQQPGNDEKEEEAFLELMHDMFCASAKDAPREPRKDSDRITSLVGFIKNNFSKPISLQDLSDHINLNLFHVIRMFKQSTGLSPYDYLIHTRIEFAKTLLKKGRQVQEAAQAAGFYDASHFCRLFKRTTGISPKDYRSYKSQYHTIFTA
jgi:AraC-like DNA-binding protein